MKAWPTSCVNAARKLKWFIDKNLVILEAVGFEDLVIFHSNARDPRIARQLKDDEIRNFLI
jgi:hypothetical protein